MSQESFVDERVWVCRYILLINKEREGTGPREIIVAKSRCIQIASRGEHLDGELRRPRFLERPGLGSAWGTSSALIISTPPCLSPALPRLLGSPGSTHLQRRSAVPRLLRLRDH